MSLLDIPDVFIGSTDDGHTFVVLNRRIRDTDRLLTDAGFLTRERLGRTLYLLPPGTAQDAHERAGIAMYGLLAHTHDLVDLAWTTRQDGAPPSREPDVTIRFTDHAVTATAATGQADAILAQHGFIPAGTKQQHALPPGLGERDALSAVVRAEAHLYAVGISVHIGLGIATPQDIPPAPSRPGATPAPPPTTQVQRCSR
ncbi:hypothetical protein PV733_39815 [Streptomyces europaeiscabiei]|uniref:hypothetical protein n=1 Tax=Streptomyces europaeiscabiei TaxID=146819 RepID=UPI0029ABDF16|nr:hypothetical protein [Streptomyces europaeiscabiei]MDX3714971.1 hypothetical protein [Streptomyces europaeiscabiei]